MSPRSISRWTDRAFNPSGAVSELPATAVADPTPAWTSSRPPHPPPHLHFGIYAQDEGPIDPFPFIHQAEGEARRVAVDLELLGGWARTRSDRTPVRLSPHGDAEILTTFERHAPVRILGGT